MQYECHYKSYEILVLKQIVCNYDYGTNVTLPCV